MKGKSRMPIRPEKEKLLCSRSLEYRCLREGLVDPEAKET